MSNSPATNDGDIHRWPGRGTGRSRAVRWQGQLWAVASAPDDCQGIAAQIAYCLQSLDRTLTDGGSDRTRLLSVQVILADMSHKAIFDEAWNAWIGPDPKNWPQRFCIGASLAPELLVELIAIAACG